MLGRGAEMVKLGRETSGVEVVEVGVPSEWSGDQRCYQVVSPAVSQICSKTSGGKGSLHDLQYRQVGPGGGGEGERRGFGVGVLWIKVVDLIFHLYLISLLTYCLYINISVLLQQIVPGETLNKTTSEEGWLGNNVSVLGKEKWTMSFSHFTLIFSIFHAVYAILATICDLFFFHCLCKRMIRTRYISTVLPVHRLFFLVISCIDTVMFVTTTNITLLVGDVFVVILVLLISLVLAVDTSLVLLSLRAVFTSKEDKRWSLTWHHSLLLVTVLACTTYSLLSQALPPSFTWEVWAGLGWGLLSSMFLIRSLVDRWTRMGQVVSRGGQGSYLTLFLGISGSNVLGLLSVGTVVHRLVLDYQQQYLVHS